MQETKYHLYLKKHQGFNCDTILQTLKLFFQFIMTLLGVEIRLIRILELNQNPFMRSQEV